MQRWTRRLRGAIRTALTWAAGWGVVGGIFQLLLVGSNQFLSAVAALGLLGALSGLGFSLALAVADGRRRFDEMSLLRFAGWGALGGALGVTVLGLFIPVGGLAVYIAAALGAGSAAGSLAIARAAEGRELTEAEAHVEEVGLTKEELQKLLGG